MGKSEFQSYFCGSIVPSVSVTSEAQLVMADRPLERNAAWRPRSLAWPPPTTCCSDVKRPSPCTRLPPLHSTHFLSLCSVSSCPFRSPCRELAAAVAPSSNLSTSPSRDGHAPPPQPSVAGASLLTAMAAHLQPPVPSYCSAAAAPPRPRVLVWPSHLGLLPAQPSSPMDVCGPTGARAALLLGSPPPALAC